MAKAFVLIEAKLGKARDVATALDKLEGVKNRFDEVGRLLTEPDIVGDMKR